MRDPPADDGYGMIRDRAFGSVAAANFGSQGTRVESLLRRMQHGELDGYQAKLVVLQTLDPGDRLEYVAGKRSPRRPRG